MQTIYTFSYNPVIAVGTNTTGTNWRMAYQQPLMLYKGTTNTIKVVVFAPNQHVVNLTNYSVRLHIVDRETQEQYVTRTADIPSPPNGIAMITFTADDLQNLQHRFYHVIAKLVPNSGAEEILYIDDNYGAFTPVTLEDAYNFAPTSISTDDGIPAISFTNIDQTPNSFLGSSKKFVRVNAAETAVEFANFSTFDGNIIPSINDTFTLGNSAIRWNSINATIGNIASFNIAGNVLSTSNSTLSFKTPLHGFTFTGISTLGAETGTGSTLQFDDTEHGPGPTFETWYGDITTPWDPEGQHSLDIRAANANSYVELASYDWNNYVGVDNTGVKIWTNWNVNANNYWTFGINGWFTLPSDGRIISSSGNTTITMGDSDIRFITRDVDGSTLHTTLFDTSGDVYISGNLYPGFFDTGPEPLNSIGSPEHPWKDLYISNTTIYMGGIPLTVDGSGTLFVNNNPITANTANITFSSNTISTVGTNEDITLSPNGTGNVNVSTNLIPLLDNTYDLGSPARQWRHLFVANGSVYIDNIKLTNANGKLAITKVVNPGEEDEEPDPEDSDASSELKAISELVNGEHVFALESNGTLTLDGDPFTGGGGGGGLPTITVPGETGSTYKGLQVSYGMIHSNGSSNELNVNKIVIHKPAATTTEIDPTGGEDFFKVSGLGNSDVLAMFVIYGDTNGPKSLSTLETFAQAVIDNVILNGGVAGQYNTLANMKVAFYESYATLASAANGLDLDFEFYNSSTTVNTGTTTTRQGSGASFIINNEGDTTYSAGSGGGGTNYRVGHKILIPGTSLFGVSPDNDCIVTVTAVIDGAIDTYTVSGIAPGSTPNTSPLVSGTNHEVGAGFSVGSISFNNLGAYDSLYVTSQGTGYVTGDVVTLLGSGIQNGTSPTNDITITITSVDGIGAATGWTATGNFPRVWPSNYISDGGNDQYDSANYINSSFDSSIPYNQGATVADGIVDGIAVFGEGAAFSFVYETGIFGLLVTGNESTFISTSGNSGADGGSTTEAGNLYGPDTVNQTFDNAVTHINFVGDPWAGPIVTFARPNNSAETIDILIPDNGEGAGVAIARANNANGIYNPYREGSWDSNVSPGGTLWNTEGWNDLSDVTTRNYQNLYAAFGNGGLGNKIVGKECVMYLPDNGKYYAIKFDSWTQGGNGGGFAYTRREIDINNLQEGIRFSDGTRLKSAAGVGRVKLESPGSRRIEEVYGYKQVGVSQKTTTNLTSVASRAVTGDNRIWIDSTATTIDNIIDNPGNYQVWDNSSFEFSLDDITYYKYTGSISFSGNEWGISTTGNFTYNQGDTIYFRYSTGAQPVVWWDAADLPGGSSNFRGAVIDYHAYTGQGTIVGTIHIVKDSGEEHISHTEVQSGSTDSENDDLWLVQNEGTISYRRIDGEAKVLKIQWSAKVFYGLEFWD